MVPPSARVSGAEGVCFRELTEAASDLALLARFHGGVYLSSFPDADERETLANMRRALRTSGEGRSGKGYYHVILALDGERILGGAISDYLAEPNCGVIEFIAVDSALRGQGMGSRLHDATVAQLRADARENGQRDLDAVLIELDDPRHATRDANQFDPVRRALIWDGWGYRKVRFPYIQPALSPAQRPVDGLMLAAKPLTPELREAFPASLVRRFLEAYLRLAMRICCPADNPVFTTMARRLDDMRDVPLEPLSD